MEEKRYRIYHHPDMGYAFFELHNNFWQQVTKWYSRKGALKRYNPNIMANTWPYIKMLEL